MRITSKMISNNLLSNINKNKNLMTKLEDQYMTGKKIQKPSDDPIIAVRSLKLRTSVSEISQYYDKNIPDARSWMEVTESSLSNVNKSLTSMNTYCVQGSTDTLTATDRSSIASNLEQLKQQIYQEGNANYAGRYVFTGYKTNSSLTFTEQTVNLKYTIMENMTGEDIELTQKVSGSYSLSDYDKSNSTSPDYVSFNQAPTLKNIYRLQLSYDKLDDTAISGINYSVKDSNGESIAQAPITANKVASTDANAYSPAPGQANFIYDTGELILSEEAYNSMRKASDINVTYTKSSFNEGDLKPEHYFDCKVIDTADAGSTEIQYKKSEQAIEYEVNFNQKLKINTEGSDAITHKIGRVVNDIIKSVNDVKKCEDDIEVIKQRMEDASLTDTQKARYQSMLDQYNTDLILKKEVMQKAFTMGQQVTNKEQDRVNVAVADLGSRTNRLNLTENRLSTQRTDFTELLSTNEDADQVETYVNLTSAQNIYNASLSATAKVIKNSLLDYL